MHLITNSGVLVCGQFFSLNFVISGKLLLVGQNSAELPVKELFW